MNADKEAITSICSFIAISFKMVHTYDIRPLLLVARQIVRLFHLALRRHLSVMVFLRIPTLRIQDRDIHAH